MAKQSETLEELVIYKSIADGEIWAMPKSLFIGTVDGQPRFTLI